MTYPKRSVRTPVRFICDNPDPEAGKKWGCIEQSCYRVTFLPRRGLCMEQSKIAPSTYPTAACA